MPLYIADYRNKTAHLTASEHGAYLLLIMHYWTNGSLPEDEGKLMRIAAMTQKEWKQSLLTLQEFFHDGWKHTRIDDELAKATEISSKRRAAAEQRHSKRDANAPANAEQLDTHAGVSCSSLPSSPTSLGLKELEEEQACGEFAQFWLQYPHKVGKKDAEKKFSQARKTVSFEKLMFALSAYVNKTDDRPWCNPATWLNQGRWDDEPGKPIRGGALGVLDRLRFGESEADQGTGDDAFIGLPPR